MIATGVDSNGNVLVRPLDDTTAGTRALPLVMDGTIHAGDEVVVGPVGGGEAVYGRVRRTAIRVVDTVELGGGTTPTVSLGSGAGTGATATLAGDDSGFRLVLTTGTGTAIGTLCTITFDTEKIDTHYGVWLSATDSDAANAGMQIYCPYTSRATTGFDLYTGIVLPTSRSHYWFVAVMEGPG